MDIGPIKTQRDYRQVLKAIDGLMTAKRNTPEGDRLDVLVTLVEAFEGSMIRSTSRMPSMRSRIASNRKVWLRPIHR
jgi:antitoxin component HigA of HigAB toxin-antitoxin module